ncbi:transcriptional regulator [Leptolyngbya sp. FACHB-36]|uniref:transcriptional regulator n=1 Tax=Leptolyngbya sp. FACHB-36 TaxID=2692808 RepID=UPI0016801776|nr:transcriptional regulator [Leptolyngbya sp. FACHB-36]MBD2021549.1 transcriptional regulator [Leptolyngbya sp. FACHB-36]
MPARKRTAEVQLVRQTWQRREFLPIELAEQRDAPFHCGYDWENGRSHSLPLALNQIAARSPWVTHHRNENYGG